MCFKNCPDQPTLQRCVSKIIFSTKERDKQLKEYSTRVSYKTRTLGTKHNCRLIASILLGWRIQCPFISRGNSAWELMVVVLILLILSILTGCFDQTRYKLGNINFFRLLLAFWQFLYFFNPPSPLFWVGSSRFVGIVAKRSSRFVAKRPSSRMATTRVRKKILGG